LNPCRHPPFFLHTHKNLTAFCAFLPVSLAFSVLAGMRQDGEIFESFFSLHFAMSAGARECKAGSLYSAASPDERQ